MLNPSALKRRKLNDASGRLFKPFVSPLKVPKATLAASEQGHSTVALRAQPYLPSIAAHTIQHYSQALPALPLPKLKPGLASSHTTPIRRSKLSGVVQAGPRPRDTAETTLQKDITVLEQQIRQVQREIDTLQQAQQLQQTSTDARLEALTTKWRQASQAVAEEVFPDVKERVQQAGGVAAWRQSERRRYMSANAFDWDEKKGNTHADGLQEDERETGEYARSSEYSRLGNEQQREAMAYGQDNDNDGGEEDTVFTIEMMLQALNIELDVIGYNPEAQAWI